MKSESGDCGPHGMRWLAKARASRPGPMPGPAAMCRSTSASPSGPDPGALPKSNSGSRNFPETVQARVPPCASAPHWRLSRKGDSPFQTTIDAQYSPTMGRSAVVAPLAVALERGVRHPE